MNQYQVDLIEDPPPKCPYFTLPDPQYFVTPEDLKREEKSKVIYASLVNLFGAFDKMSDDQQTQFILNLIKHSNFTPNYEAMAADLNISNGGHVRRRYIAIAEKQGFKMNEQGDMVQDGEASASNPTTNRKRASRGSGDTPQRRSKSTMETPKSKSSATAAAMETRKQKSKTSNSSVQATESTTQVDDSELQENAD